ncbi:hypothetical protein BN871_HD_00020 [Paenibacillus sp. P22]|nr:hypothetical protein BN871_HD_00020 [Paenibacillus sp. P22]
MTMLASSNQLLGALSSPRCSFPIYCASNPAGSLRSSRTFPALPLAAPHRKKREQQQEQNGGHRRRHLQQDIPVIGVENPACQLGEQRSAKAAAGDHEARRAIRHARQLLVDVDERDRENPRHEQSGERDQHQHPGQARLRYARHQNERYERCSNGYKQISPVARSLGRRSDEETSSHHRSPEQTENGRCFRFLESSLRGHDRGQIVREHHLHADIEEKEQHACRQQRHRASCIAGTERPVGCPPFRRLRRGAADAAGRMGETLPRCSRSMGWMPVLPSCIGPNSRSSAGSGSRRCGRSQPFSGKSSVFACSSGGYSARSPGVFAIRPLLDHDRTIQARRRRFARRAFKECGPARNIGHRLFRLPERQRHPEQEADAGQRGEHREAHGPDSALDEQGSHSGHHERSDAEADFEPAHRGSFPLDEYVHDQGAYDGLRHAEAEPGHRRDQQNDIPRRQSAVYRFGNCQRSHSKHQRAPAADPRGESRRRQNADQKPDELVGDPLPCRAVVKRILLHDRLQQRPGDDMGKPYDEIGQAT